MDINYYIDGTPLQSMFFLKKNYIRQWRNIKPEYKYSVWKTSSTNTIINMTDTAMKKHLFTRRDIALASERSNVGYLLTNQGLLYSWGENSGGQLGLGDTTNRSTPTQIGTATWNDFKRIDNAIMAIRSDGTLWGWGENVANVLWEIDNPNIIAAPVQLGNRTDWNRFGSNSIIDQTNRIWYPQSDTNVLLLANMLTNNWEISRSLVNIGSSSDVIIWAINNDNELWYFKNPGTLTQIDPSKKWLQVEIGSVAFVGSDVIDIVIALDFNGDIYVFNGTTGEIRNNFQTNICKFGQSLELNRTGPNLWGITPLQELYRVDQSSTYLITGEQPVMVFTDNGGRQTIEDAMEQNE